MNPHQSSKDVSPLSHRLLWWLLRIITQIGHANQTVLSRWLARLAPLVARRRMRIVRANLAICFPGLKPSEQEALTKKVASSTILGLLETLTAWVRPEHLPAKRLDIEGLDLLREERHLIRACYWLHAFRDPRYGWCTPQSRDPIRCHVQAQSQAIHRSTYGARKKSLL